MVYPITPGHSFSDLCELWQYPYRPAGESIQSIFEQTTGHGIDRLKDLCRSLQEIAGSNPFHLDCRTAGKLSGVSFKTANKWLNRLEAAGVLTLAQEHKWSSRGGSRSREFYFNERKE